MSKKLDMWRIKLLGTYDKVMDTKIALGFFLWSQKEGLDRTESEEME